MKARTEISRAIEQGRSSIWLAELGPAAREELEALGYGVKAISQRNEGPDYEVSW